MDNPRGNTHFWTDEQTRLMLNQLKEMNILKFMDGRKTRNGELFKKVALKMVEAGFPRTHEQVRIRWKNLKKAYFQAKRDNGTSGRGFPFYDVLDELLGSRPLSLVEHNGVDSGVQLPTTMDTTMDPEETETTLLGASPGASPGSSSVRSTPACTPLPSSAPLPTAITADLPGTRTQQSRRMRDVDVLVNQMQVMNQEWKEHMKRSEAREERLIASILQRTDRMVEKLMQRMDNIQPQPNTFSPPSQHHHHQPPPSPAECNNILLAAEESVERSCEGIDIDMEEEPKSKRKRNGSDDEWAPSIEGFMPTSDKESGSEEEEEDRPFMMAWCRDCGEESSTCCSEQDHRQLYCCVQCGYREDHQGPACTDGQETQNMDNPKAPTASYDVSELSSSKEQGSVNSSAQGVTTTEGQEDTSSSDQDSNTTSQLESSNSCHQEETVSKETHNIPMFAIYFSDLYSLQSHVEQSHGFKRELCPDCGKFLIGLDSRCSHVCDHKIKPFSCLTCGRCFTSPAGLHLHSQVHTEGHALPCRYCYKTFRFQEDKLEHEKIHLEERLKYRCPDCRKRFADRHSRSAHRKTHWKHGRFFCKVCDNADNLKRHEVVHTCL